MSSASAEPPTPEEPPKRSPRRWILGSATDWISVLLAASALVVSIVSCSQSQQAQKVAQEVQNRERAMKVGFWRQDFMTPPLLHITNRNSFDIKEVTITFADGYFIKADVVPACTMWTLVDYRVPSDGSTYTLHFPARLDFVDANDPPGRWTVEADQLRKQTSRPFLPPDNDLIRFYRDHIRLDALGACT